MSDFLMLATWNTRTVPENARCQEASPLSSSTYIPCLAPAVAIIDNGDRRPYFMCGPCANHNVHNRRATALYVKPGEERWVEK